MSIHWAVIGCRSVSMMAVRKLFDFEPFLAASAHPAIRAYLDPDRFATCRIEHGDLVWGDYDLCFPIVDLYLNRIVIPAGEQKAA